MIDTNKLRQLAQGANEHSGDRAEILAEFYAATQSDTIIELLDRLEAAEKRTAKLEERCATLTDALRLAVRQNSHDMLMTGDELRQCEAAMEKSK